MREKQRIILVEGQNKVDKTRKALETIQYWDGDPVTSERARKTAEHYIDDDKTSQKTGGRALTFITTTRITDSQHETLLQILNENEFDALLYSSDKARTQLIKDVLNTGVNVHDVKTGVILTTRTPRTVLDKTLDAIREHYRTERITKRGLKWTGGRPPLGFRSDNGELVEVQWFDQVRATLKAVTQGDMTQTQAADDLDCTRKTIRTALDNPDRYNLD